VKVYYDRLIFDHDTGPVHPENRSRLIPLLDALAGQVQRDWTLIDHVEPVTDDLILSLHDSAYFEEFRTMTLAGGGYLHTLDCPVSPGTLNAARVSVALSVRAVESALADEDPGAFVIVRPPGHHALANRAMGFCYFNNVALAAHAALERSLCRRIGIVDFDAHHGNGTQELFYDRDDVLYISLHGDPSITFPGTGYREESGAGDGEGFTLNLPMKPGVEEKVFLDSFDREVLPALEAYRPDLVLVSCGFDAHREDALVPHLALSDDAFSHMIQECTTLSRDLCGGRIVMILEGGYTPAMVARLSMEAIRRLSQSVTPVRSQG